MTVAKKILLHLGKIGVVGVLLALIFWLMLTLVYCIPQDMLDKNVKQAVSTLQSEGLYPESYSDGKIDNYTVAVMINEAYQDSSSSGGALQAALLNPQYYDSEKNRVDSLVDMLSNKPNSSYERYWNGYLVFLKPLLVIFDLKTIRTILQVVMLGAIVACCYMMTKKLGHKNGIIASIAIICAYGSYNCFDVVAVLPLASSFLLSIFATIWVLSLKEMKLTSLFVGFFVVGSLTVYFDFLDNPLLTLCVPLSVMALRWFDGSWKDETLTKSFSSTGMSPIKRIMLIAIVVCIGWVLGYAYLWALKWLIASVVLDRDVIANAMNAAQTRTSMDPVTKNVGIEFYIENMKQALDKNLNYAGFRMGFAVIFVSLFIITLIGSLVLQLWCKRRFADVDIKPITRRYLAYCILVLVISLLPYFWYVVLANHSVVHAGVIAFRNQLITLECSLLLLGSGWIAFYSSVKSLKEHSGK